jgi:hypothetical protein
MTYENVLNEMKPFLDSDSQFVERSNNSLGFKDELKIDVKYLTNVVEISFLIYILLYYKLNASLNACKQNNEKSPFENQFHTSSLLNHPKYAQYFKKRVCTKYVPDSK